MRAFIPLALVLFAPFTHALGVPESCRISSPEMQLASTCYSGDLSRVNSGGQFVTTHERSTGVNFCYNSLIITRMPNATGPARLGRTDAVEILVLKDNEQGQFRSHAYNTNLQDIQRAVSPIVLKGLVGQCFARLAQNDHCSGFLGFGREDIPFAVRLNTDGGGVRPNGIVGERRDIDSKKALTPPSNQDVAAARLALIQDIARKMTATAQAALDEQGRGGIKAGGLAQHTQSLRTCMDRLQQYVQNNRLESPFQAGDDRAFAQLTAQLKREGVDWSSGVAAGAAR